VRVVGSALQADVCPKTGAGFDAGGASRPRGILMATPRAEAANPPTLKHGKI
jgi:hypothetical protein